MLDRPSTFPALLAGSAFIAATAVGACEEAPVTPEAPPIAEAPPGACNPWPQCKDDDDDGGGGGEGGGKDLVDVAAHGAMVSNPAFQKMKIQKENKKSLNLQAADQFSYTLALDFDDTQATAQQDFDDGGLGDAGPCSIDKGPNEDITNTRIQDAIDRWADLVDRGHAFVVRVDKDGLDAPGDATTSEDHNVGGTWQEDGEVAYSVDVGAGTTVEILAGDIDRDSELLYSGGFAQIKDMEKPTFAILCPLESRDTNDDGEVGDAVEVEIDRP